MSSVNRRGGQVAEVRTPSRTRKLVGENNPQNDIILQDGAGNTFARDIVVLEHGVKPRSGTIVAALVGEQSILRTLLKQRGKTFLRSGSPQYPHNIPVEKVVIQGVFKALIRRID